MDDVNTDTTQAYAKRVTDALEKTKGVTAFKVLPSSDGEVVRVRYQGPARQADLYSALNFDAALGRPRGVSLMLYKIGGTL